MDAANRRQQLHAKLLCVLCKLISQETRINPAVLARRLKVDQHAVNELRPFHPEIFKLIARYEKLRGLWAKGRLSSGRRPGNKKRRIDPLLTRPLSLEA